MTPRRRLLAVVSATVAALALLPAVAAADPTPGTEVVTYSLPTVEATIGQSIPVTLQATRDGVPVAGTQVEVFEDGSYNGLQSPPTDANGAATIAYPATHSVLLAFHFVGDAGDTVATPAPGSAGGPPDALGQIPFGVHGRPVLDLLSRRTVPTWRAISLQLDRTIGGPYYDPQLLEASVNGGPWTVVGSTNQLDIPPEGGAIEQNTDTPQLATAVATRPGIWQLRLHDPGSKDLLETIGAPVTVRVTARKAPAWLAALNRYRAQLGSLPVGEDPVLSAHDLTHAKWMAKYHVIEHGEQGRGATDVGDDAGKHSDLILGSVPLSGPAAVLGWMRAPFHALCLLNPALQAAGFGAYGGAEALDCLSRLGAIAPASLADPAAQGWPRIWPNSRTTLALNLDLFAGEIPDPTAGCRGLASTPGLPMLVSFGPIGAPGSVAADLTHPIVSLTDRGHRVAACVRTPWSFAPFSTAAGSLAAMQTVLVIPTKPLVRGHSYKLTVTAGAAVAQGRVTVGTR